MAEDFNKGDFNKGNTGNRIDFHEAQRLSMEHFEKTYPEFCEFFNKNMRLSSQLGDWEMQLNFTGGYLPSPLTCSCSFSKVNIKEPHVPATNIIINYAKNLGFDITDVGIGDYSKFTVNWVRRDGRKYP